MGRLDEGTHEEPLDRVGGRRHLRRDLLALVFGALFVAGALLKPWGPTAIAVPAPTAADAEPTPAATVLEADVPAPSSLPPRFVEPSLRALSDLMPTWEAIDRRGLAARDAHTSWGVAVAALPLLETAVERPARPEVHWVAGAAKAGRSEVVLPRLRLPLAISVTWPKSVHVQKLTFEYIGSAGAQSPYLVPQSGLPPFVAFEAVSVQVPAVPPPASVPSASGPAAVPAHAKLPMPVLSGTYWVPPSTSSPPGTALDQIATWHAIWPWPLGDYLVRAELTQGGTTTLEVRLSRAP